ncbi:hypothetical protein, partial [Luteimonas sp. SDU101]|uniref:hypothetical protein n=1 Tax=Luteimonas sp. SDU101 TaxID=3422593 RepID=UPI003EBE688D
APAADQGAPAAPAAFPAPARAQLQDGAPASGELVLDQHRQLVRFGATMHAAADFCEMDYDDAERERLRRQQREAMVGMGAITAAQFDAAFDAGIGQAREAFTRAPPAELRGMCDDLLRLRGATPQG